MDKQENKNIVRICSTCGFTVTNALVVHCPRCNTTLCKIEHTCAVCVSKDGCATPNLEDIKNDTDK